MTPPMSGVYADPERRVVDAMDGWLDTPNAVQTLFTPWQRDAMDHLFETLLPRVWNAEHVPLLTWEPYLAVDTASDVDRRIATGDLDSYLDEWAGRLADWLAGPDGKLGTDDDRRLYLRLAHEMNGDWYPWSPTVGESTPDDYVDMWRHVYDAFARADVDSAHCQWIWCVNHADVGDYRAEPCYPGDEYVDWVGVDGFNWGHSQQWSDWHAPATVFDDMLARLHRFDKPLCVPEVGCSTLTADGHDPARKADWLRAAVDYFDGRVQLYSWFNEDKETDWAVFGGRTGTDSTGGYACYPAYREALADHELTTPPIDDAVFRGV